MKRILKKAAPTPQATGARRVLVRSGKAPCHAPPPAPVARQGVVNAFAAGDAIVVVNADGTMKRRPARLSCFIKGEDATPAVLRQLRQSRSVAGLTDIGGWWRVDWRDYDYRRRGVQWLEKECGCPTYEGDVSAVLDYLVNERPLIAQPVPVYLDIETDSRIPIAQHIKARTLCWVLTELADGVAREVARGVLADDSDDAERDLLAALWRALLPFDQVRAWMGEWSDDFDFTHIIERSKLLGIRVAHRRWLWLDQCEQFKRANMMAAESGEEKQSFGLNAIAMAVLGEGKIAFDTSKTFEAWANATPCATGDCMLCRQCLVDYCAQDALLMPKIEAETGYCALLGLIAETVGIFCDSRAINPQTQVEALMLRLYHDEGMRPRTRDENARPPGSFAGAYVMHPKSSGILRDVHVCDFASMYPSIIRSFNISPETLLPPVPNPNTGRPAYLPEVAWKPEDHIPPGAALAPYTHRLFDQGKEGVLCRAIAALQAERDKWSAIQKKLPPNSPEWHDARRRTTALKIAINSFYGVVGAWTSRFFSVECAESVTQIGRWLLEQTMAFAEQCGMASVYGDTDSCFITGCTADEFRRFVARCNAELYPRLLKERGAARNFVKLDYEKQFSRLCFAFAKGKSAAKKYCNPPEAPIWMGDLSFKRLGDVRVGDEVIGWDAGNRGKRRRLRRSKVVAVHRHAAPIVKVTMASGREIRCTPDHRWLSGGSRIASPYVTAKVGRKLAHIIAEPSPMTRAQELEAAWLGGIYDGEGSLSGSGRSQIVIAQSPSKNPEVCARIESALGLLGIAHTNWLGAGGCNIYALKGSIQTKTDFVLRCSPAKRERLVASVFKSRFAAEDEIVAIAPDGEGEVVGLTTETGNYIAWGYASKNCGRYAHYKGTTPEPDATPEIRGLEYRRGDALRMTREMQFEVIELICRESPDPTPEEGHALIERWKDRVLQGPLELGDVVESKGLTQALASYKTKEKKDGTPAAQPPHVMVARELKKRGHDVREGLKIVYYCADGATKPKTYKPAEDYAGDADRFELWESKVYPPSLRLLDAAFAKAGWDRHEKVRPAKIKPARAAKVQPKRAAATARAQEQAGQSTLFAPLSASEPSS